jgi:hypothetical protein
MSSIDRRREDRRELKADYFRRPRREGKVERRQCKIEEERRSSNKETQERRRKKRTEEEWMKL